MAKSKLKLLIPMICLGAGLFTTSCTKDIVEVTDIYFSNLTTGKKTMTVGEEFTLEYSVIPEELQETAEIVWETSDKNVARVRKGKITAEGPGEATITASCGSAKASALIKVKAVQIESIDLPGYITVPVGGTVKVEFSNIVPENGSLSTVDWRIETYGEGDATLELDGEELYVTGTKVGMADFAAYINGVCHSRCEIEVEEYIPVESVSMTLSKSSIQFGESLTVSTSVLPSNASSKEVAITCSPSSYVAISGNRITAKEMAGTVTVYVNAADGKSAYATFEILAPPLELTISHGMEDNDYAFLSPDGSVGAFPSSAQLTLKANNQSVDLSKAVWTSSAPSAISVDGNGLVTSVGHGYVSITAKLDGATASIDMRSVKKSSFSLQAREYGNKTNVLTSVQTPKNQYGVDVYDPAFANDPNEYAFLWGLKDYFIITATPNGSFTASPEGRTYFLRAKSPVESSVKFSLNNGSSLNLPVSIKVSSITFIGYDSGKNYGTVQKGGSLTVTRVDEDSSSYGGTFEAIEVWCNYGSSHNSATSVKAGTYTWNTNKGTYDPFEWGALNFAVEGAHTITMTEFDTEFSITLNVVKQYN